MQETYKFNYELAMEKIESNGLRRKFLFALRDEHFKSMNMKKLVKLKCTRQFKPDVNNQGFYMWLVI